MFWIKKVLLNPKIYIAAGAIIILFGCIVGHHENDVKCVFPNPQFYKSVGLIFGGYIFMAIFTFIDAKKLMK